MNLKNIKRILRKAILRYDVSTYYFAQCGEDAILHSLFQKQLQLGYKGFYVDIGAYHPTHHSNSYFFYINGWHGINIDACPGSMLKFQKQRPRDINLELGVAENEDTLTYYFIDKASTMNSFSKENLVANGMINSVKKEIPVAVKPLSAILEKHLPTGQVIDFLSIDVEGLDLEALKSNNWDKFRPRVILIELDVESLLSISENKSFQFLVSLGYIPVAKNFILKKVSTVFFVDHDFLA